jgi:hypothetical protein
MNTHVTKVMKAPMKTMTAAKAMKAMKVRSCICAHRWTNTFCIYLWRKLGEFVVLVGSSIGGHHEHVLIS